jgi:dTMP kinase
MAYPGFFLVFEGGDGVGKTTQATMLADWLASPEGGTRYVTLTREPGGTALGAQLRDAVMHGGDVSPRAEALLYAADRAQHVDEVVFPALEQGDIVVQDRFIDSSIAYQAVARGLGEEIGRISAWAADGLVPDLTIVLDMEPDSSRIATDPDRLERETWAHANDIRQAFLTVAEREPARYLVVDASLPVEVVHANIRAAVQAVLPEPSRGYRAPKPIPRVGNWTQWDLSE